ncbi:hypothetical protein CEUSTIGMA_g9456.t1 [Chlamydomonas eustigma]|uniref:Calcineurin-like phosphoesterase domain-containing protein n=1 Tax=Chlamydomonas eustigma TaxID=1157962 RepID=A0A250XG21_9CHLO|nr:hypothetical protein CEUSTIGMA_g9456.t1 [Chlamydomonas eustigma]|eukprot:GAX82028.1 hypothetical protein CEUSTIGMA_g9456.t1 [Chlamydomonas eustigma]
MQLVLLALLLRGSLADHVASEGRKLPTLLLQLSDLHISVHSPDSTRIADLKALGTNLLSVWRPDAIVISGDLTDGKTVSGKGAQQEKEWALYHTLWRQLANSSHLPASAVMDVRGNHDTFDVIRGSPSDFFTQYSATAHYVHERSTGSNCGTRLQAVSRELVRTDCHKSSHQRVHVREVKFRHFYPSEETIHIDPSGIEGNDNTACPAVLLLSVDATPDPGLRGPTNFLGVAKLDLLLQVEAAMNATRACLYVRGCAVPPVIALGHHPLSTIALSPMNLFSHAQSSQYQLYQNDSNLTDCCEEGAGTEAQHPHISNFHEVSATTLTKVLMRNNVSLYLNGHLHDAFGVRLHKHHEGCKGKHLLELVMTDWKLIRSLRLIAIDDRSQAGATYVDLSYKRPTASGAPSLSSADPDRVVGDFVVIILSPMDARYSTSPLSDKPITTDTTEAPMIRVLLLTAGTLPASPSKVHSGLDVIASDPYSHHSHYGRTSLHEVTAIISCGSRKELRKELLNIVLHRESMAPGKMVYSGSVPDNLDRNECVSRLWVQVVVKEQVQGSDVHPAAPPFSSHLNSVRSSKSDVRPVYALSLVRGGRQGVKEEHMAPFERTWVEWTVLSVSWQSVGYLSFLMQWFLLMGLLIVVPRCKEERSPQSSTSCVKKFLICEVVSPNHHHHHIGSQYQQAHCLVSTFRALFNSRAAVVTFMGPIKWIWTGSRSTAALPSSLWWPLVLYLMYLPIGPWMLACVSTLDVQSNNMNSALNSMNGSQQTLFSEEKEMGGGKCMWGFITAFGIYVGSEESWWHRVSTEDMLLVTNVHMLMSKSMKDKRCLSVVIVLLVGDVYYPKLLLDTIIGQMCSSTQQRAETRDHRGLPLAHPFDPWYYSLWNIYLVCQNFD